MAIVEDEVRNESEEENEIEVVVEDYDGEVGEQESYVSFDEDDEALLKKRVSKLQRQIDDDPFNYDLHIELLQTLWNLAEVDKWRAAFEHLQEMGPMPAMHWLMRLQTEVALAHSEQAKEKVAELFEQASLDTYSVSIFSEWCTWCVGAMEHDVAAARDQLEEVLRRAGADPLSGKLFWDARLELEKGQLGTISEESPEYNAQRGRVLWCLEEIASRPLLRSGNALSELEEFALSLRDQTYFDKIKKQHEAAMEFLQKITPYEDKLLTMENPEEKCKVYQEYIDAVKELSEVDKYAECDCSGILNILYDRATSECQSTEAAQSLLVEYARFAHRTGSRATHWRVLRACARRSLHLHTFWTMQMHQAEHEGKSLDEVKAIFERALSKGMESYKQEESLWLSYIEFIRRSTDFECARDVERLRRTFRLAWDSLAAWGDQANDCEIPLYWARIEYKRLNDPKQGKEIVEEIFKYGDNKTLSKYWEAFIQLESSRSPPPSENKLRDLYRRALKFVSDYPPGVARLWTDYERDYGTVDTMRECTQLCDTKIKEWRDNYQAMKDKMTGQKGKQQYKKKWDNKKSKIEDKKMKKDDTKQTGKGKRKSDESAAEGEVKRKKEANMDVDVTEKEGGSGTKRSHEGDESDSADNKRQCTENATTDASREACTLFVSNLEFKVNEQSLREKLSAYGEITSIRVRAGVKAFGGSICYCQYATPESVDEAVKHDRTALDGRPMFLSRYSSSKAKPTFKYPTTVEKNKLFVKNLSFSHCTQEALKDVFDKHGKLKDIRIVTYKDGKPKGLAYIEYEDEASAARALEKTNGQKVGERNIEVALSAPPPKDKPVASLGQSKRDATGGMRRTQLSRFIPRVLQVASTSGTSNSNDSNGDEKRPLSNSDFRDMLLNK